MMSALGVISQNEKGGAVHFERRFDLSPDELWPYLTEATHLSAWITPEVVFEPRVGGRVHFAWPKGPPVEGRVLVYDPPRLLQYEWKEGEADSLVRLELRAQGAGSLLIVDHSGLPLKEASGFGAGWHAHVDWLEQVIAGHGNAFDQDARFRELAPQYGYELLSP
jgi:uncharacterized protein YndB with AHSA1/START domain